MKSAVATLTREILAFDGPPGVLAEKVAALTDILASAATFKIDPALDIAHGETASPDGQAISPAMAAMCAGDFQRTAVFLRGLHDAIADASEKIKEFENPPRPVRILYAGSGPYATLTIPLMSLVPAEQTQFTILDLHEDSIESVKSIVESLGLAESVTAFEVVDACHYTIPADAVPDIIVSETMNAALEKEPQVAIMRHLMDQAQDAIMVPRKVRVDATLLDPSKEFAFVESDHEGPLPEPKRDRIPLGTVFELSAETIRSWSGFADDRLPAASIQLPRDLDERYQPFLMTTVVIHGEHVLQDYDSGLTNPRTLPPLPGNHAGGTLDFCYRLGNDPGLAIVPGEERDGQ